MAKLGTFLALIALICLHNAASQKPKKGRTLTKVGDGYYYLDKNAYSWHEAEYRCQQYGLKLLSVESKEEIDLLGPELIKQGVLNHWSLWIGLNDQGSEGRFHWSGTGEFTGAGGAYTAWFQGQPDNHEDREHCVSMDNDNGEFKWNDLPCDYKMSFVCELPQTCWGL